MAGRDSRVRWRVAAAWALFAGACACAWGGCGEGTLAVPSPPGGGPGGGASLAAVADGGGALFVDGRFVEELHGADAVDWVFVEPLAPGRHAVAVRLDDLDSGAAGAAAALWIALPDGGHVVSDGSWQALAGEAAPADGWLDGSVDEPGAAAALDRGGYGAPPWRWQPRELCGTTARWIAADDGGGAGWLRTTFEVGEAVADRWEVSPSRLTAGEPAALTLTFTAGDPGVAQGETRTLYQAALDGALGRHMLLPRWTEWQVDDPDAAGHVAVAAAPDGVTLALDSGYIAESDPATHVTGGRLRLTFTVESGAIAPGETVVLGWGEPDASVRAPLQARRHSFPHDPVEAAPSMDYPGATLGFAPAVEVVGGEAVTLAVATRGGAAAAVGEAVALQVTAVDRAGNAAVDHTGVTTLTSTDPAFAGPAEVELVDGAARFEVTFQTPGLQRVALGGEPGGVGPWIRVSPSAPALVPYFGDLHAHSLMSDGIWPVEESYRHADEVAGLDFAALTDHAERLTAAEWDESVARAGELRRDDFVTLVGYEWTGVQDVKHRCVYSRDGDSIPVVRATAFDYPGATVDDVFALFDALDGAALTVAHHPGSLAGGDHGWADHDGSETLIEIYSKHGSSECAGCEPAIIDSWAQEPGNYVQDALAAGLRLGFVAASDGHETPLGGLTPDHAALFGGGDVGPMQWRGGLTAVWAPELSQAALLEALEARQCYATTGARMLVDVRLDGAPMGAVVERDAPPTFLIHVGGTAPLERVELLRFDEQGGWVTVLSETPDGETADVMFTDAGWPGDALYYLRVTQQDGHRAWASPVWVEAAAD